MKKILFLLFAGLFSLVSTKTTAQIITPRFATTPSGDNTGRVLTYGYRSIDYAATNSVFVNYYESTVKFGTLTGDMTLTANVTLCHVADKMNFLFQTDGSDRVVTFSTGFSSGGNITIAANSKATIYFVFNGVGWFQLSGQDLVDGLVGNGTAAAPTISFASTPDLGLYRVSATELGFTAGGTKSAGLSTTGLTVTGFTSTSTILITGNGAVGTPAHSFISDPDCGAYRIGANNIGYAVAGAKVLDIGTTGLGVTGKLKTTVANVIGNTGTAINTTATVTAAQLAGGLLTSTSAATVTMTLPTATLMATEIGAVQGTVFDFIVDNSAGANTVTVAVGAGITASGFPGTNTLTVPASSTIGIAGFRLCFMSATAATLTRIN